MTTTSEILTRMRRIVEREQLVHGTYNTRFDHAPTSQAPCGGANVCALGALWTAAGAIQTFDDANPHFWELDRIDTSSRDEVAAEHPGMAEAREALDHACVDYMTEHHIDPDELLSGSPDLVERLFEGYVNPRYNDYEDPERYYLIGDEELLEIIDAALASVSQAGELTHYQPLRV